ncbi:MAG: chromosome partitioning protein [Deltaproteobacteria bacterium]|nr:MAG: chromosome partitioning protein [Deltaproteobacteria bacterium]
MTTAHHVFDDLSRARLLIVSGKGGVGRTTVAAMLGLACARRDARVLVGTTGTDDRLAWMLGRPTLDAEPREAATNLFVQRFDPQTCIVEYGGMMAGPTLSKLVLDNGAVRRFLRALPGLDDYAVLGKAWHEATRGGRYDVVVLDGPATGHLRYVLGVPSAIVETVPSGVLSAEARRIDEALRDDRITRTVYVGLAEPWPLSELAELAESLEGELGIAFGAAFVNGLWPACTLPGKAPADLDPLRVALDRACGRGRAQRSVLRQARGLRSPVVGIDWHFGGIEGPEDLAHLLERARMLDVAHDGAGDLSRRPSP